MSKFTVAYSLCPLIDQNHILGISEDSLPNCANVTLGKNIVIRYKLKDQKQLNSWSTKDKLSSYVVYDKLQKRYVGVFSCNKIRVWKEDEENLDKVKAFKFVKPIHSVLSSSEDELLLVLFKDGGLLPLPEALDNRNKLDYQPVFDIGTCILSSNIIHYRGKQFVALCVSNGNEKIVLYLVPVSDRKVISVPIERDDAEHVKIVGHAVMLNIRKIWHLITLWSDGCLYGLPLEPDEIKSPPGKLLHTMTNLNCRTPVAVVPVSPIHIVVYGADPDDEGALLLLMNLQHKIVQARLHFKLFSNPPIMHNVGNNLIVVSGHSLIVVPYNLQQDTLASILGHQAVIRDDMVVLDTWDSDLPPPTICVNADSRTEVSNIKEQIKELASVGHSQAAIVKTIVSQLIEAQNIAGILYCLESFVDIPESVLIKVMKFCLSAPNNIFRCDVNKETSDSNLTEEIKTASPFEPVERQNLINATLNLPHSDALLLPLLKSMSLDHTLIILQHLEFLLGEESVVSFKTVLKWMTLLLDAHYQEYVLCERPEIVERISVLSSLVKTKLDYFDCLKSLTPVILKIQLGKCFDAVTDEDFATEVFKLYPDQKK